ncbi:Na+/H+ antiporter subunit E [Caldovatus aquaticus]|uniref:Na+/H+ antiporter subunit E n=1 Tax=Caldovatus aquaticus TaxID=2865671 RepID=A0ABS7F6B3_9PROT|nr:Na+/H+ antiporter subunit E [Caldovatus aquaticus]MBW8271157.1 Na+/H+ antiporter subunit E [Caldovatus aquaticus]
MKTLRRLLPQPVMSLLIFGLWLILAEAPGRGQVLIALALAIGLPPATRAFWPDPPRLRAPGAGLRLLAVVLADIVVANIEVARRVAGPVARLRPAFLEVPLAIADPFVATILGSIVSLTPGTVSVEIDRGRGVLLVHALHVEDPAAAVARIKARYEAPLKEVFGC